MTTATLLASSSSTKLRELVSPELFDRLAGRIVKDEGLDHPTSEAIVESALGFLKLICDNPGESFSPSPMVDIGWHTFILYTRGYAEFCKNHNGGAFIHHEPNDVESAPQKPGGIQRTIDALRASGQPVNRLLWTGQLSDRKLENLENDCSSCVTGGSCSSNPGDCTSSTSTTTSTTRTIAIMDGCTSGGSGCGSVDCDGGSGSSDPGNDCSNG
jgi:hypothetical protein